MSTNVQILVVDDDKRYYEPLIDRALNKFMLELNVYENWEEAESELSENVNLYAAIILDGKGKLTKDSHGDDPKHLKKALEKLDILKGKGIYIPRFINTAYYNDLIAIFGDEKMYSKNKDEVRLFEDILEALKSNQINKIKTKYPEPFESFGKFYLSQATEAKLIEVLVEIENNSWTRSSFNTLRQVLEAIYLRLHEIDDELIPYGCVRIEKRQVNFKYCSLRLRGEEIHDLNVKKISKVIPDHLGWLIEPLDKVCSICSHTNNEERFVNKYSLQTITFGVMEMLIWFKTFIDENYEF